MKHLDIEEVFKFHIVFDELEIKRAYYDIFEAIEAEILGNFSSLKAMFDFDELTNMALEKLAFSDRKILNLNKIMPRILASKIYSRLFKAGLISLEPSREIRLRGQKYQRLKRQDRRYVVQDKVHFCSHFVRFWFRFIQPNLKELEAGDKMAVMSKIRAGFDEYASLGFELLGAEYLAKNGALNVNSFWHKNIELDMLGVIDDKIVVGEAKYKSKKVCKNVLNMVLSKCVKLGIKPWRVMLFSKSGFSNELVNLKDERVRLVDIKDMTELLK
ncbi:DUF234 domain-containing protein [Campylobacter mucosalis]|uniref:DUF234 domain-containing protein n=1 Tax=Campylobacter mucosalis TaxID=202 RepID=UPI0014704BA5|nr:DUF234 domain-containing protein [Campylobacter mucosalis]